MSKSHLWLLLFVVGCASTQRECASCSATNFGADWIVVQYRLDGQPLACWRPQGVSMSNEEHSDGIYWKQGAHLLHISGWYNYVQVTGNDWDGAARELDIDLSRCVNGAYRSPGDGQ